MSEDDGYFPDGAWLGWTATASKGAAPFVGLVLARKLAGKGQTIEWLSQQTQEDERPAIKPETISNILRGKSAGQPATRYRLMNALEFAGRTNFDLLVEDEHKAYQVWCRQPRGGMPATERPPLGFRDIDEIGATGLGSYLRTDVQPYYGFAAYAAADPPPPGVPAHLTSETALLDAILAGVEPWIIHGEGGAGKTRLAFELGRAARSRGFAAFVLQRSAKESDVREAIAEFALRDLLLIVDYVETMRPDFSFDRLHDILNRARVNGSRIWLVATCRSTFFQSSKYSFRPAAFDVCRALCLTATGTTPDDTRAWLARWLQAACRSILPVARPVTVPVVAVILKHLSSQNRNPAGDLDADGRWIMDSLLLSLRNAGLDPASLLGEAEQTLLGLLACFPISPEQRAAIDATPVPRAMLRALETDGWLHLESRTERATGDGALIDRRDPLVWALGHDLLFDLSLRHMLNRSAVAVEPVLRELARLVASVGCQRSAAINLERNLIVLAQRLGKATFIQLWPALSRIFAPLAVQAELAATVYAKAEITLSLTRDQRLRVLLATPRLRLDLLVALDATFDEEARRFALLANDNPGDIAKLINAHFGHDKRLIERAFDRFQLRADLRPKILQAVLSAPADTPFVFPQPQQQQRQLPLDRALSDAEISAFAALLGVDAQASIARLLGLTGSDIEPVAASRIFEELVPFAVEVATATSPDAVAKSAILRMAKISLSLFPIGRFRVLFGAPSLTVVQWTGLEKTFVEEQATFAKMITEHPNAADQLLSKFGAARHDRDAFVASLDLAPDIAQIVASRLAAQS